MRMLKFSVIFLFIAALAACASVKRDYQKDVLENQGKPVTANNIAPIQLGQDESSNQIQPAYPVPQGQTSANVNNLTPPGSNLPPKKASDFDIKKLIRDVMPHQPKRASEALYIAKPFKQAWKMVGIALPKTKYELVEHSIALKTYYIIDKTVTNGQVTKNTPLYQVKLSAQGKGTKITLYDLHSLPVAKPTAIQILTAIKDNLPPR